MGKVTIGLQDILIPTGFKASSKIIAIEWLARACASGISHGDVSIISDTILSMPKNTRMGMALSVVLEELKAALRKGHKGQMGSLPALPEGADEVTGKSREILVNDWSLAVARATITAAEVAAGAAKEAAKAAKLSKINNTLN